VRRRRGVVSGGGWSLEMLSGAMVSRHFRDLN
jgi:hypothetical protein